MRSNYSSNIAYQTGTGRITGNTMVPQVDSAKESYIFCASERDVLLFYWAQATILRQETKLDEISRPSLVHQQFHAIRWFRTPTAKYVRYPV